MKNPGGNGAVDVQQEVLEEQVLVYPGDWITPAQVEEQGFTVWQAIRTIARGMGDDQTYFHVALVNAWLSDWKNRGWTVEFKPVNTSAPEGWEVMYLFQR